MLAVPPASVRICLTRDESSGNHATAIHVMSTVVEQLLMIFALLLCYAFDMHGWLHEPEILTQSLALFPVGTISDQSAAGQINQTVIDATCLSGGEPIICPRAMCALLSVGHSLEGRCKSGVDGTHWWSQCRHVYVRHLLDKVTGSDTLILRK